MSAGFAPQTDTIERVSSDTKPVNTDEGDHDRFAHYVTKTALERAIFDGVPTRALCGKMWLPTKDATRFPVCSECKEAWEALDDE